MKHSCEVCGIWGEPGSTSVVVKQQRYFEAKGSPQEDPDYLDGDAVACEELP